MNTEIENAELQTASALPARLTGSKLPGGESRAVEILRPSQISETQLEKWLQLISNDARYESPYYHLEFSLLMDEVRDHVRVAVVSVEGAIRGFFPFQSGEDRIGYPIGGMLNDFHGAIGNIQEYISPGELLKACNLKSWNYHAADPGGWLGDTQPFKMFNSPFIDLSDGFDAYHRQVTTHSSTVRRQPQKFRRMLRELGPMRFEFDSCDESILDFVIRLKRDKYQSTGAFDAFSIDWTAKFLHRILETRQDDFQGLLSAMWAGDELVAAHFGMANQRVIHYWFPVYKPQFHRYSPGTQLMLEVCREAAQRGIQTVDLGYGQHAFKHKFTDTCKEVGCGVLQNGLVAKFTARNSYHLKNWIKTSGIGGIARSVVRKVHPNFGQQSFR